MCTWMPTFVCQIAIDLIVDFRIMTCIILFNEYFDVGTLYSWQIEFRMWLILPQYHHCTCWSPLVGNNMFFSPSLCTEVSWRVSACCFGNWLNTCSSVSQQFCFVSPVTVILNWCLRIQKNLTPATSQEFAWRQTPLLWSHSLVYQIAWGHAACSAVGWGTALQAGRF
jgi:hypothetical protein